MDKIRDFRRWHPNCHEYWHFSRLPGSLTQHTDRLPAPPPGELRLFLGRRHARLMHDVVRERSFIKDRRVIDVRIDSGLMVCGTPTSAASVMAKEITPRL